MWMHPQREWRHLLKKVDSGDADAEAQFFRWQDELQANEQRDIAEVDFVLGLLSERSQDLPRLYREEARRHTTEVLASLQELARHPNAAIAAQARKTAAAWGIDPDKLDAPDSITNEDGLAIMEAAARNGLKR